MLVLQDISAGWASEYPCGNVDAVVFHDSEPNTGLICDGATEAVEFLDSLGLVQKSGIEINIVESLPPGFRNAMGYYDRGNDEVFVVESSICLAGDRVPEAFKVPNDREICGSYVAHEVAHAIAARNFAFEKPSAAAHEYIAGVVQLSVLSAEKRSLILSRFKGDGYDDTAEINFLHYQINPARFAVEAYRHYAKIGDGPQFIRQLISGDVRLRDRPQY